MPRQAIANRRNFASPACAATAMKKLLVSSAIVLTVPNTTLVSRAAAKKPAGC